MITALVGSGVTITTSGGVARSAFFDVVVRHATGA